MTQKLKYRIKKYDIIFLFTIVVALQLLVASLYMNSKQHMYIDEFYCYAGAHNALLYRFGEPEYYLATNDEWYDSWHTKKEFMEWFEVRGEESILRHSPAELRSLIKTNNIYYIMLNIVESFQSDPAMTKWSGFVLNSIIFVLHQIVLYLIGREIFRDKKKALLPMIIYGFSAGGISLIIFIRFYLLISLACLFIAYIHVKLLEWRNVRGIIAAYGVTAAAIQLIWVFQPYIVMYACSVVLVFAIICLFNKEYKFLLKYVGVGCAGLALFVLFVPNFVMKLSNYALSSYGVDAITAFFHRTWELYAIFLKYSGIKTISHVAGGVYTIAAVGIMLAAIWCIQCWKGKIKWKIPEYLNSKACLLICASICYYLLCNKAIHVPWYRYLSCIYPGLCVGIAILFEWVLESCRFRRRAAVVCAAVLIGLFFGYMRGYVDDIYPEALEMRKEIAEYPGIDNLIVETPEGLGGEQYYRDGYLTNDGTSLYLTVVEDIYDIDYKLLDELDGEGFLCWFPIQWDDEYIQHKMERVLFLIDYKEYEKAFTTYHSNVYYVY